MKSARYAVQVLLLNSRVGITVSNKMIQQMIPFFKTYGITKAALFGFAARGQNEADSDIDLVVSFVRKYDLLDIVGLKQDLEDTFHTF